MYIYNIQRDELNDFCEIQGAEEIPANSLINLWDSEISKPEWCFVVDVDSNKKGRVGFMKSEDGKSLNMFGLHLEVMRDADLETSRKFLSEIFNLMENKGFQTINYHLESDTEHHETILEVLKKAGMHVTQPKRSYILHEKEFLKQIENRLDYKTLSEVGKEDFVKAIETVTDGTLDREDERVYKELGNEKAAQDHMTFLMDMGDKDDTWYLAYSEGLFAGLVIPQKFDEDVGAINYIGVDPVQRGKGYVSELLKKGIVNLFDRKVQRIIADIDEQNFPMENALKKVGFREEKKIWVLKSEKAAS